MLNSPPTCLLILALLCVNPFHRLSSINISNKSLIPKSNSTPSSMAKTNFPFPSQTEISDTTNHGDEFQESDIWISGDGRSTLISQASLDSHMKNQIPIPRSWKRSLPRNTASDSGRSGYSPAIQAPSSLPVNIPDWSKILGAAGDRWRRKGGEDPDADLDDSDDDEEEWIPPHEYAARQMAKRSQTVVAFSVHEGEGRPLKGRDLWRLRNVIWKQTGFEA